MFYGLEESFLDDVEILFAKDSTTFQRSSSGIFLLLAALPPEKVKDILKTAKLLGKGDYTLDAVKLSAKEWQTLKDFEKSADTVKTIDRGKDAKKASGVKIPSLNSLADEVVSSLGGKASLLKNGYKVEIPNGRKPIVVRIMDEGSGG